jgi:hypothetical protein
LALTRPIRDVQTIFVSADETLVPYATEDLLDRYAPGVLRLTSFVGRQVPADLTRARTVLGFRAQHTLDIAGAPFARARPSRTLTMWSADQWNCRRG